jgi:hypothetical protein
MRWVWPLCLVACSSTDSRNQADPPETAATSGVAASQVVAPREQIQFGAPPAPVAKPASPVRLWNARPGVPIAAVFATPDGSAAVSIDQSNHARLWPSLDGKREPWVVPLTMPRSVAVERDGDGFALAALDDSGGIELVSITSAGELTTHAKQPPEPGFEAVIANAAGFLVLRRDQTLQQLDAHGAVRATLHSAPGEHVIKLLHRGGRTLALVRTKDGVRGHWLTTDKLEWADQTPKLSFVNLRRVFVSPDHKRLVTFREPGDMEGETLIIDLETGRSRALSTDLSFNPPMGAPVGFSVDQRIVLAFNDFELSTFEWWKLSGHTNARIGGTTYSLEGVAVDDAVVTDTNVISFAEHELAVVNVNTATSPTVVKFIGYRTRRAKAIQSSPIGVVATIGGSAMLLDEHVRVDKRVPALETVPLAKDLAVINFTTRDWAEPVVNVSNGIDPEWLIDASALHRRNHGSPRVALFDLDTKKELQRWPSAKRIYFEPASQLMAMQRGSKITFARFDPATRTFGADQTIAAKADSVMLLDPALAGGNLAMLVRRRGDELELSSLSDLAAPLPEPMRVTGTLESLDRAGHVYMRVDADTIVVHGRSAETRITGMTGWTLRPSPTGDRIAAFAKNRLMLLDERGEIVWSVGFPGVTAITWTSDGAIVVLAGDIAKLDAATGRVVDAQCGWGFAARSVRPEPVDFPSTTETLCDQ